MSTTTANLGLFKYNTATDGNIAFSIDNALNANWDILDTAVGTGGSPTTVVSGDTWYRQWSDGWKEQGGLISLSETELYWEQPTITTEGTLGGDRFAVTAINANYTYDGNVGNAALLFDKYYGTKSTQSGRISSQSGSGDIVFYNPVPLNIYNIKIYTQTWGTKNHVVYGSNDNDSWTILYEDASIHNDVESFQWTFTHEGFYKYFKIHWEAYNYGLLWREIEILAKYKTFVANSITFPVAFNNTNYSYTFACQDGGGMDAYVSNKTTTGMSLSNTNSGSASWTACGY